MGKRAERRVQPQEPVSFLMVKRVVEQGKWRRLKTMKARAVHRVHPAARRAGPRAPEAAEEDASFSVSVCVRIYRRSMSPDL